MTALDELDAVGQVASLPVHALDAPQVLASLDRLEIHRRRQPSVEHALITHLQDQATAVQMGAKSWRVVLSSRLGISGADASRRIVEAAQLGTRTTVTGDRLDAELPTTAEVQSRGQIGTEHVTVIRDFMAQLPRTSTRAPEPRPSASWRSWQVD